MIATTETQFLTPPEAARLLGVDAGKILDWIHSGELEAADLSTVRGGRPRWRISVEELKRFLDSRKKTADKPVRRKAKREKEKSYY